MAGITMEEMRHRENEAYKAGLKKAGKGKTTKALLWVLTALFWIVILYSLGVWVFKERYPEGIVNVVGTGYFAFLTAATVKSGAENYGKITNAEQYNTYYGDA